MELKKHYIPITKVDEEKRLVYLLAASETTDYSGESMDYDKSKPNFEKWSNETYTRSAGKSYGNIREMHSSIAAGKLNEPLIFDDEAKTVSIVVYVSDDNSWKKVQDGTLTGASIGGSYESIVFDPVLGVKRYVADLTEISLVDSPCNPDAVITVIKSNGSVEMRKAGRKGVNMNNSFQELTKSLEKNLTGDLKKSFSFDDIQSRLRASIRCRLKETDPQAGGYSYGYDSYYCYGYFYVIACYDDSIVINGDFGDNGANYNIQIGYTIDDTGVVTLGDASIVNMVPEVCNDNDGDNEALERFMDKATSLMEKGIKPSEGIKIKMKKLCGGNEMTEQETQEALELKKAMTLVMSKLGTPEEMETFIKSMGSPETNEPLTKAKVKKEEEMTEAKKAVDPDKDDDDDSSAEDDKDKDMADKKKAKKSIGSDEDTAMAKALGSFNDTMGQMLKFNESLQKRITALEAQPTTNGPVATAQEKTLGGAPVNKAAVDHIDGKILMLKDIMSRTNDMGARDSLSREMATLEMSRAQSQPIIFNG